MPKSSDELQKNTEAEDAQSALLYPDKFLSPPSSAMAPPCYFLGPAASPPPTVSPVGWILQFPLATAQPDLIRPPQQDQPLLVIPPVEQAQPIVLQRDVMRAQDHHPPAPRPLQGAQDLLHASEASSSCTRHRVQSSSLLDPPAKQSRAAR